MRQAVCALVGVSETLAAFVVVAVAAAGIAVGMRKAHKVVQDDSLAAGSVWLALTRTTITSTAVLAWLSVIGRSGGGGIAGGNGGVDGC